MKAAKENKKIILTGMRPTGALHIGHYAGVLTEILRMQKTADTLLVMIADAHGLTTMKSGENLKENTLALANACLATGVNPSKAIIFVQSHVPQHSELSILLSMVTPVSMLALNPVYKEMREDYPQNNNLGLLAYPVMQAADILLYKTSEVPIGKDQLPHLEISREIARRFNARFGDVFIEPRPIIQKESKILSLQNPSKKMSKSHEEKSRISILDSPETIREKIKAAVTDSGNEIKYDEKNKPAISNLLLIYSIFSGLSADRQGKKIGGKPIVSTSLGQNENKFSFRSSLVEISELEKKYTSKNYVAFKNDLAEVIISGLSPIQKKYKELEVAPDYVKKILRDGAEKAKKIAAQTMKEAREKIGFLDY